MAKGPSYRVPFRRRREGKTNYRIRKSLILSDLPRLVVRGTSKHMIVQVAEARENGDVIIASAHSRELVSKYGWRSSCSNIPAAYLTGLLCGYKAVAAGVVKAILDLGLQSSSPGNRIFAATKGFIDAGVNVPQRESVLPDESRISGRHIVSYASQLTSIPDIYQKRFSKYLSRGLNPEELYEHFSILKNKLYDSFREEPA